MEEIQIFTDGACSGNPGPGGWGVICIHPIYPMEQWGSAPQTTNNRMELTAAITGVKEWTRVGRAVRAVLLSDSQYVVKGITQWIYGWRRNGWRTANKKEVENRDLWETLWHISEEANNLSWQWVRGHDGHPGNEAADALARRALAALQNIKNNEKLTLR